LGEKRKERGKATKYKKGTNMITKCKSVISSQVVVGDKEQEPAWPGIKKERHMTDTGPKHEKSHRSPGEYDLGLKKEPAGDSQKKTIQDIDSSRSPAHKGL